MFRRPCLSFTLVAGSLLIPTAVQTASAEIITLSRESQGPNDSADSVKDSFLRLYDSGSSTLTGGGGEQANVGKVSTSYTGRAIIEFDLSDIPDNSTIDSATLHFDQSGKVGDSVSVSIHRLKQEFVEATASWQYRQNTSGGAASDEWDDWDADSDQTRVDTATDTRDLAAVPADFDVKSDVQGFVNGDYENHGWDLVGPEGGDSSNYAGLYLSEKSGNAPVLTVEYTPIPEPGSLALLGLGGGLILLRRTGF